MLVEFYRSYVIGFTRVCLLHITSNTMQILYGCCILCAVCVRLGDMDDGCFDELLASWSSLYPEDMFIVNVGYVMQ